MTADPAEKERLYKGELHFTHQKRLTSSASTKSSVQKRKKPHEMTNIAEGQALRHSAYYRGRPHRAIYHIFLTRQACIARSRKETT